MPAWLRSWLRSFALILAGLAVAAAVFGTPHIRWKYTCRYQSQGGGCQVYDWCEYYGIQGRRVLFGDECGRLLKLLPVDWNRMFGGGR